MQNVVVETQSQAKSNNDLTATAAVAPATPVPGEHPYKTFINPELGTLLEKLNLNKRFVRGEGQTLIDADGNRYLDFVSAYGALPFGHNPQPVWEALQATRERGEPSMIQPSYLEAAGDLAQALIAAAPRSLKYVTFSNSGTEAVEAAIKACRSATGRPGILATHNGFHGKTLGALSATGREEYQDAFFAPAPGFDYVPYGDATALEAKLAQQASQIAAFIVEPIQGEGGVVVPPAGYLKQVREICDRHGVLMILDEVQTGLGRTGMLFACEKEGVEPDAMTLAKALGGGLLPIGAVLLSDKAFNSAYAMKHSSTFAGNTLACRAGLAALRMLTANNQALVKQVRETGAYLKEALEIRARKYPRVLARIRGEGLMLGMEFRIGRESFSDRKGALMGFLGENQSLTPLIASYLLNVEKIRVVPTLNGKSVIRVQPPLNVTRDACEKLVSAVERVCAVVDAGRTDELLGHLVGRKARARIESNETQANRAVARGGDPVKEGRFAFLVHLINEKSYAEFDESLERYSDSELTDLAGRWNGIMEPSVIGSARIKSAAGVEAYGEFIALQRTAKQLQDLPEAEAVAELKMAVDVAQRNGAQIIGLGGYTSVVCQGGRLLTNAGVPLTTGNSFTTLSAIDAVGEASKKLMLSLERATVSVIGAGGSIGSAATRLLASQVGELILVGNPRKVQNTKFRLALVISQMVQRLKKIEAENAPLGLLAASLLNRVDCPKAGASDAEFVDFATKLMNENGLVTPIRWTVDCDAACAASDVIVTATSSTEALIRPEILKPGAIICDVSRPANVSEEITLLRPDVLVIDGGVIAVPGRPDLGWSFGYPQGLAYACMCETMMLALERRYEHISLGSDLNDETLDLFRKLSTKHGFKIAEMRQFGKQIGAESWDRLISARTTKSYAFNN